MDKRWAKESTRYSSSRQSKLLPIRQWYPMLRAQLQTKELLNIKCALIDCDCSNAKIMGMVGVGGREFGIWECGKQLQQDGTLYRFALGLMALGRPSTPTPTTSANGDSRPPYLFPNTSDIGSGCALANLSRREIRAALMEAALAPVHPGFGKATLSDTAVFIDKRPLRGAPPPPSPTPEIAGHPISFRTLPTWVRGAPSQISPAKRDKGGPNGGSPCFNASGLLGSGREKSRNLCLNEALFGGEKRSGSSTVTLSNTAVFIDKRHFSGEPPPPPTTPATGDNGPPYLFPNASDMGSGCALANLSRREIRVALMEASLCSSASGVLGSGREKSWNLGLNEALFGGGKKIGELLLFLKVW
ncbi:hypothetical protein CDAR_401631 [Caerostris darwini]|uniref:Uncharacterized protein n=1 Tax=Caerostris darwini TaxID=1538125 RepID=A0AAV4RY29_9ARAC|nr:hypothetical protein CDAR_401631 [Caerostris darwini]